MIDEPGAAGGGQLSAAARAVVEALR